MRTSSATDINVNHIHLFSLFCFLSTNASCLHLSLISWRKSVTDRMFLCILSPGTPGVYCYLKLYGLFIITQIDFLSYREDFTSAAVFTELRSRIPQVHLIMPFHLPIIIVISCQMQVINPCSRAICLFSRFVCLSVFPLYSHLSEQSCTRWPITSGLFQSLK